jgi:hypothetical protein
MFGASAPSHMERYIESTIAALSDQRNKVKVRSIAAQRKSVFRDTPVPSGSIPDTG